jgi:hypothetical protein
MPILEELDLSNCRLEVIAGIDNEQDRTVLRQRCQDQIVNARGRSHDSEIRCTKDPS